MISPLLSYQTVIAKLFESCFDSIIRDPDQLPSSKLPATKKKGTELVVVTEVEGPYCVVAAE